MGSGVNCSSLLMNGYSFSKDRLSVVRSRGVLGAIGSLSVEVEGPGVGSVGGLHVLVVLILIGGEFFISQPVFVFVSLIGRVAGNFSFFRLKKKFNLNFY